MGVINPSTAKSGQCPPQEAVADDGIEGLRRNLEFCFFAEGKISCFRQFWHQFKAGAADDFPLRQAGAQEIAQSIGGKLLLDNQQALAFPWELLFDGSPEREGELLGETCVMGKS